MDTFADITKELKKFGLSENQAAIYLFLIRHGALRIQEIANGTQIPRSSVYENIENLLEFGLVEEIVFENFKKIKPYPLNVMRHRLQEKIMQLKKQTTDLDNLEKALKILPKLNSLPSTTVRYYKDISGARQLFWNTLKARSMTYVYSEYGRPKYVGKNFYMDFVRESKVRNIEEQVLINPTPRVIDLLKIYLGSPITRTRPEQMRTVPVEQVLIKGETFIYDNIYAQVYIYTGEINGFEIESDLFTSSQRTIFETLWNTATPLTQFINKNSHV